MILLRWLSRLPFRILYLIADFLFLVTYYLIRYRREVVWKNLINSFPDKPHEELRLIEKQFYRNLADTTVETLKLLTISEKQLLARVKMDNTVPMKYHQLGYSAFGMTAHFCNWEWLLVAGSNQLGLKLHAAYKRLRNHFFNNLMIKIRSRFGVVLHEKDEVVKDILLMHEENYLMAMVADQRPFKWENKYWTKFLHQETAYLTGTELLARRKNIKVLYASMKRIGRGYYEVCFKEIERNPKDTAPGQITEKFIEMVEQDIRADPAAFLWTHDRWKHKKPTQ
jgi:Kdo2-lipid IVA lauroyltransferase/acyltransferase